MRSSMRSTWTAAILLVTTVLIAGLPLGGSAQGNSDNAHACRQGGWQTLAREEARTAPFANQGECISYSAQGGTLVPLLVPTVTLGFVNAGTFMGQRMCSGVVTISGFPAGTYEAEFVGQVREVTVVNDGETTSVAFSGDAFYEGSMKTVTVNGLSASAISSCSG